MKKLFIFVLLFFATPVFASGITASLDSHTVAITIYFTGNEVLLFGAAEEAGDVIVLVQGPRETRTIRKKGRAFGVWYNSESMEFANVPGYYAISYSGDNLPSLSKGDLLRHEILPENLNIQPVNTKGQSPEVVESFRQALIEQLEQQNSIANNTNKLERLGDNLFRTSFFIPSNAPIGTYRTEVFLVSEGKIISAQATPLFVSKTGIEAHIYNFAYNYSAFYGVMAIFIAAIAGYIANEAMRKR